MITHSKSEPDTWRNPISNHGFWHPMIQATGTDSMQFLWRTSCNWATNMVLWTRTATKTINKNSQQKKSKKNSQHKQTRLCFWITKQHKATFRWEFSEFSLSILELFRIAPWHCKPVSPCGWGVDSLLAQAHKFWFHLTIVALSRSGHLLWTQWRVWKKTVFPSQSYWDDNDLHW